MTSDRIENFLDFSEACVQFVFMYTPDPKSSKKLSSYQDGAEVHVESIGAFRSLNERSPGAITIRWNPRTGRTRSVRGVLTGPLSGEPEEIARQFLVEHRLLFGIREHASDLEYVRTTERRGMRHVLFRQRYEHLPVVGTELSVHIDQANQVQMVNGNYYPDIEVDTSSALIPESTAIETVMKDLETDTAESDARIELTIVATPAGGYRQAYQVSLRCQNPHGDWIYFVDAISGEIVDSYNAMLFAKGKGHLYNSNPERDDDVVTADLFDLNGDDSLSGTYFQIENAGNSKNASPTGPGPNDFLYADPADSHFDEVMVYYHLSNVAEFFRNLGHNNHQDQMTAHVHVPDPASGSADYDNAYFSPLDNAIYFGHGKALNDLAKEAAVIYHEYAHSIIHAVQPFMGTHEAGALHEGYADYFACSLTNDPKIGEFVMGELGLDYLRNLRNSKTYIDRTGTDIHADGEIWGAICWQIRETLGSRVTDALLYESLWFLPQNANFVDAYDGIVQADMMGFSGAYQTELEEIFTERKIVIPPVETHIITANAGSGGEIVPAGEISVNHGADQTFTWNAESNYQVKQILVDGDEIQAQETYTFQNVSSDHQIEVFFEHHGISERTVIVPGNMAWMDSGLTISTWDNLSFSAHGRVFYDNQGHFCGPGGTAWTDSQDQEDPLWQHPHAGLIGEIEGGAAFFIGTSLKIQADRSGKLLLGINDFWYQGNSGEFTVTIQL